MARGANHKGKGVNLLFWLNFAKNCMKMKRMGGGCLASLALPWTRQLAMGRYYKEAYVILETIIQETLKKKVLNLQMNNYKISLN